MDPCCDPEVTHGGRYRPTMFRKQVSRPVGQSGSPIVAAEAEQVERTRRETWSRALSEVLVPFRACCRNPDYARIDTTYWVGTPNNTHKMM